MERARHKILQERERETSDTKFLLISEERRDSRRMESMRLGWRVCVSLLLVPLGTGVAGGTRPEVVLADVLTRPFVPREFASSECIRDGEIYLKALERYTPWALQMFDASVKVPSGLITGNSKQLGNFDECLRVKNEHGFIGQACNAEVQFEIGADDGTRRSELDLGDLLVNVAIASNATNWTSGNSIIYEWMFCVPSTCNHTEIQEALELALDPLKVEGRVDMTINVFKQSCRTVETVRTTWDVADWCYTSILVLLALIIIASTGYDIAMQRASASQSRGIFTAFSLYKNGKELLRTDRRPGSIRCLDGLRFISICWIIYGHTYYMEVVGVKMDLTHIPRMHHDWNNMLVLNGNIVTDTFFLLSGLLLAYTELSKKERALKWRFDMIGLYVHRYVRLTPAYAMMIGFYATLFYKFGTGPHWDAWVGTNKDYCRENWWTNLLYVNNYVNVPNMCMSQSWYLSTDMQFVWLSPLVLYPMLKFRSLFLAIVLAVCLFLSVLVPFITTYSLRLTGTMLYYKEQMDVTQVYLEVYIKTYNRFGPYVIGLGLGYLLYKTRSYKVKLHAWYVFLGWLLAVMAGLSVIFGPRGMYFDTHVYNRLEASFYAAFHRQVFVLSVSWIVFCCMHGYAGPINYLLSWRGWIPLSKLTYCAYLSHYLFILSHSGAVRTTGSLTQMDVMRSFFANLVFTMMFSALWSLCFEMPFMTVDSILLSGRKQNSPKHLKACSSAASGQEICQSKESSITYDTPREYNVTRYNLMKIAKENCENGEEHLNNEAERSVNKIYFINPVKRDETWSAVNSDNRRSDYVNVDLGRIFDKYGRPTASSSGKESESLDSDSAHRAKPNQSLRDSS
ncbi:PREDICTED: nose resistant to fluoxetine protein 6-like isoform X2 [Vollenhovia emeryi]|uniref:nose resistant to fluoxetine protein 6-like isoform X2 n=1 Tax=Vollenhovia emeryi TaxID=411798 RepID=UPI0005F57475|nr:PREDICTED: nose resistant to fluoxetine protein 6-like isoform X2 [Vollenhovia emeryi]